MQQPDMARQYVAAALSRDPNLPGAREFLVGLGEPASAEATRNVGAEVTQPTAPVIQTSAEGMPGAVMVTPVEGVTGAEVIHLPPKPVISIHSNH